MTRSGRRKTDWGSRPRREVPTPAGPLPEPPEFLGTWRWRQPDPLETTEAWLERTARQRAVVMANSEGWHRVGQKVKVHVDPRIGGGDVAGRRGTTFQLCSPVFAGFIYVHFAATTREKVPSVRLLPLEILTPIE